MTHPYNAPPASGLCRMSRKQVSRRAAILGGGTALVGMSTIAFSSNEVSANVQGDFSVADGTTILTDESLQNVRLGVDATFKYSSNAPIDKHIITLKVGNSGADMELIARSEESDINKESHSGQTTLNGSLLSGPFDARDFQPNGGELNRTVTAKLGIKVFRNDEVVLEDSHLTTFDITVKDEELQVTATLSGEGNVEFVKS